MLLVALMVVPGGDFGQREHVLLLGLVPYLLLAVLRAEGAAVSSGLAAAVGLFGALGFLLKPYFVPVWALVEAYVVLRVGIRRTLRRPEALIVAGLGLIYAVAVVALVPAYLESVRQIVAPLYPFYRPLPVAAILTAPAVVIGFVALGVVLLVRRPTAFVHLDRLLALSLAGMILSAAVQQKGFSYHFYPVLALSVVILGTTTLAVAARQAPRRPTRPAARPRAGGGGLHGTLRRDGHGPVRSRRSGRPAIRRRDGAGAAPDHERGRTGPRSFGGGRTGVPDRGPRRCGLGGTDASTCGSAVSRYRLRRRVAPRYVGVDGRRRRRSPPPKRRVRRANTASSWRAREPRTDSAWTRVPSRRRVGTARAWTSLAFLARDPCARNELARYDSTGMVNDFIVLHRRAPSSANATAGPCD